jgi:putative phosphoribosyl transferase
MLPAGKVEVTMSTAIEHVEIIIEIGRLTGLPGALTMPERAAGLIIFAHGSGSSRLSPRNVAVSDWLVEQGCATLLFDLLTPDEAADRRNVFDIELLASRMSSATNFVRQSNLPTLSNQLPIGYFGASTGAAAALVAAAELGDQVAAIVSRGGRPDLAGDALPVVNAPTLLLVGSLDGEVIELNRRAQQQMTCESQLIIIPGASHLFEEPGTLEQVSSHAGHWFSRHF